MFSNYANADSQRAVICSACSVHIISLPDELCFWNSSYGLLVTLSDVCILELVMAPGGVLKFWSTPIRRFSGGLHDDEKGKGNMWRESRKENLHLTEGEIIVQGGSKGHRDSHDWDLSPYLSDSTYGLRYLGKSRACLVSCSRALVGLNWSSPIFSLCFNSWEHLEII